jgi:hypothetical protein
MGKKAINLMKAPRDFPHHIFAIGKGGLIESPLKVMEAAAAEGQCGIFFRLRRG